MYGSIFAIEVYHGPAEVKSKADGLLNAASVTPGQNSFNNKKLEG